MPSCQECKFDSLGFSTRLTICRKEDLDMFGNELNYAMTAFTAGYIIGEIPSNILLTRIRPSIYIPALQIVWTALTMCTASVKNTSQLYALRFLIGMSLSCLFFVFLTDRPRPF